MSSLKVALVCVSYKTNQHAIEYCQSIYAAARNARGISLQVVLVDNTSQPQDESFPKELERAYPDLVYLATKKNLGYFGGARYGLEAAGIDGAQFDFIIVSNVDVRLNPDFLLRLSSFRFLPDVGVIAPSIYSSFRRKDINPKMRVRPTKRRMRFYAWMFRSWYGVNGLEQLSFVKNLSAHLLRRGLAQSRIAKPGTTKHEKIYAPHGSLIVFSGEYFRRGGGLRHVAFLYGEEIFVAEEARRLGLEVRYCPDLRVRDFDHASTGRLKSKRISRFYHEASDAVYQHFFR